LNIKDISKPLKNLGKSVDKHSPELLIAAGVVGFVTTVVLTAKVTPKVIKNVEDKKKELGVEKLKPVDTVKATWKEVTPVAICGAASIACVIGSNRVSSGRTAALATAYKLSETAMTHYKDAVIETVGEKKEAIIRNKAAKKEAAEKPISEPDIYNTGKGMTRFYDPYGGRRFYASTEFMRRAELEFNKKLFRDDFQSLNDFYFDIGLPATILGNEVGWNNFHSKESTQNTDVDMIFEAIIDEDDNPTTVFKFRNEPRYRFEDIWAK